jgi:hypothetical protein
MLVLSCQVNDLRNFGFGDLVRVNAADADTLPMYMQHDLRGFFVILSTTEPCTSKVSAFSREVWL